MYWFIIIIRIERDMFKNVYWFIIIIRIGRHMVKNVYWFIIIIRIERDRSKMYISLHVMYRYSYQIVIKL